MLFISKIIQDSNFKFDGKNDSVKIILFSELLPVLLFTMPVLVSDNTENRCFLDTIFVRMLLPPLRKQVTFHYSEISIMFLPPSNLYKLSKLGDPDLYVAH